MKVLLVSPHFPPRYSGAGQQAAAVLERLEKDFDFTVWTLGADDLESETRFGTARVLRLVSSQRSGYGRAFGVAVGLKLLRSRFDAVWIQSVGPAGYAALAAAGLRGIPSILKLTLEGQDDPATLRRQSLGRWRLSLLNQASVLVCPSRRLQELSRQGGIRDGLPVYIPNGVDTERWKPPARSRNGDGVSASASLVWVGAIQERKRPDFVLEVFRRIAVEFPRLNLHFVGGDGRTEERRRYARDLRAGVDPGLAERITFHGHLEDPVETISNADFIVHPSRAEGLPNAVLEAMSAGVIPLVSNLPALRDLVDDSIGRLLDPENVDAWSKTLTELLTNPERRTRMQKACRRRVEEDFNIAAVSESYRRLFLEHGKPRKAERAADTAEETRP